MYNGRHAALSLLGVFTGGDLLNIGIIENTSRIVTHSKTPEPVLDGMVRVGSVSVVGAHCDLETGLVTVVE